MFLKVLSEKYLSSPFLLKLELKDSPPTNCMTAILITVYTKRVQNYWLKATNEHELLEVVNRLVAYIYRVTA